MPWKESGLMNERLKFVGRLLQGEKMAEGEGFEPPMSFHPYSISSRALWTTQPTLQNLYGCDFTLRKHWHILLTKSPLILLWQKMLFQRRLSLYINRR